MIDEELLNEAIRKAMQLNDASRNFLQSCRSAERYYGLPRLTLAREISKRRAEKAAESITNKTAKLKFKKNK